MADCDPGLQPTGQACASVTKQARVLLRPPARPIQSATLMKKAVRTVTHHRVYGCRGNWSRTCCHRRVPSGFHAVGRIWSISRQQFGYFVCHFHVSSLLTTLGPMLSYPLSLGHHVAAAAVAGTQSLALSRMSQTCKLYSTSAEQPEPIELRVSEELLSKVQDKELLRTSGLIGGKWSKASNRATYQVLEWL